MAGRSAVELLDELILEIEQSIQSATTSGHTILPSPPPKQPVPPSPPVVILKEDTPSSMAESSQKIPKDSSSNKTDDLSIDALELRVGLITEVCLSYLDIPPVDLFE